MFQYNPIMEGMKHLINIFIISTFPLFYFQNMCGKTNWDMWGSTLTPQHLTESPRTEQQSLLTCCQPLEAPWDCSLASPSSVEWKLSIFLVKLFSLCFKTKNSCPSVTFCTNKCSILQKVVATSEWCLTLFLGDWLSYYLLLFRFPFTSRAQAFLSTILHP